MGVQCYSGSVGQGATGGGEGPLRESGYRRHDVILMIPQRSVESTLQRFSPRRRRPGPLTLATKVGSMACHLTHRDSAFSNRHGGGALNDYVITYFIT